MMSRSEELFARAVKRIPGGVNSPVRAYKNVGMTPRFIQGASGPYVFDVDGNQYIDYILSWGPMMQGHNNRLKLRGRHGDRGGDGGASLRKSAPSGDGPHGKFRHGGGDERHPGGPGFYRKRQGD